jgi:membrane protein DedA with SNARE-associated domain
MFKKHTNIPILPLSALIFCILAMILWKLQLIPDPKEILQFLEDLYYKYGYFGLIMATFLESVVYFGIYFPGSLIIALAVFLSDGSFISLLTISVLVSLTLTLTATINYWLGRYVSRQDFGEKKEIIKESELFSKGLFVSMLHPNLLAFYFFGAGLEKHNFKKIIYVPIFMIPYGYLFGFLLSRFSEPAKRGLENPNFIIMLIIVWLTVSFVLENRRKRKKIKILK